MSKTPDAVATDPLLAEIRNRFGVLPNFFRLAVDTPEITENLWGFAGFGYLDNPMPSLFKERLFVYLSRFCDIRYCIARHVGFLVGLGRPAGDRQCPPETIEHVVRLIRRPLPRNDALTPRLALLEGGDAPFASLPAPDTPAEQAIFACATHVFLQTPQAPRCLKALRRAVDGSTFQHLLVFFSFVRTAHYWTKVHPELEFEDDIKRLLATHEALAQCVLNDAEASAFETTQVLLDELHSLRHERALRDAMERALEAKREAEARLTRELAVTTDLSQADRRKTEFLAMLSHELRNPLAPIRNAVEILRKSGGEEQLRQQAIGIIHRQVGQMVRLVDELLDVSRISQGKIELRREPIELASVVHHAVEAVRPLAESMDHELTVTLPQQPVYLDADPTRLAQVVGNLLNNACKFTEKGGQILLTVEREGEQAVLRVQDTGIGIAAEQLTRIFEMFTQNDPSFANSQGGLGLGLPLVKTLVEMHGGTVEARSAGVGQGSEFVVHLPIQSEPLPAPFQQPSDLEPATAVRRHILVVDDNLDAARSLATLLKLSGHEVHTANDGLEAVEASATLRPDVILLDIGLPRLDGYEAARRIREQRRGEGLKLVALTGWGQEEDRRRSEEAGFDAHLVKPVDVDVLAKILAE